MTTPRPVILYFGGYGEDSSRRTWYMISNSELSFMFDRYDHIYLDYPGYGQTEGVQSEESLREFALKAYDIVRNLETTESVTVMSYSLGNGPAVYLASSEGVEINELILLAPYNSGYDLYNSRFNIFYGPMRLLVAYKMPVYQYAANVTCPVTIIASSDDEVIPIDSSRTLFGAFTNASTNFISVEGIGHNDFWSDEEVLSDIEDCLEG
jgi:Predicted hydrolases or acyltransferases (alpha/beta hydrolase superfamily)